MKDKIKEIILVVLAIIGCNGIAYLTFLRFLNPELTEAQFLMRYWFEYLVFIAPVYVLCVGNRK